jgi:hypothetical protein
VRGLTHKGARRSLVMEDLDVSQRIDIGLVLAGMERA